MAGADLWLISIGIFCLASFLGSVNFIATTLTRRTKGMSLARMPLTCWGWFTTACVSLLAFPVLFVACLLLFLDRNYGMSFFKPAGLVVSERFIEGGGGSPLLWQHLFWFFGHPEVYLVIIPVMGVISHVMATFARKPVFGHRAMVAAIVAIGALGFLIWGHHMFVSGMNPSIGVAFSVLTLVIGVPSAVKTFNWLGTLWGARIRSATPMLFAIGFVSLFVSGGVTGLVLGQTALDMVFHDTYFVTGHFHLIGRGRRLRNIRGDLLLVPEDVRAEDERGDGKGSFLADVHRRLRDLHPVSFAGRGRSPATVRRHALVRVSETARTAARPDHDRRVCDSPRRN